MAGIVVLRRQWGWSSQWIFIWQDTPSSCRPSSYVKTCPLLKLVSLRAPLSLEMLFPFWGRSLWLQSFIHFFFFFFFFTRHHGFNFLMACNVHREDGKPLSHCQPLLFQEVFPQVCCILQHFSVTVFLSSVLSSFSYTWYYVRNLWPTPSQHPNKFTASPPQVHQRAMRLVVAPEFSIEDELWGSRLVGERWDDVWRNGFCVASTVFSLRIWSYWWKWKILGKGEVLMTARGLWRT